MSIPVISAIRIDATTVTVTWTTATGPYVEWFAVPRRGRRSARATPLETAAPALLAACQAVDAYWGSPEAPHPHPNALWDQVSVAIRLADGDTTRTETP